MDIWNGFTKKKKKYSSSHKKQEIEIKKNPKTKITQFCNKENSADLVYIDVPSIILM